jgi:hypothetical protein
MMARCPSCDYPLPDDRERLGARCPNCQGPLYEPPRPARAARPNEAGCAVHPVNEVVGSCARCNQSLCEVCRTRWRDQVVCPACIQRELETRDAAPEAVQGQARRAKWSALLGGAAWGLALVALGLVWLLGGLTGASLVLLVVLLVVLMLAGLAALFAVGLSLALLRLKEQRAAQLATLGLVLGGLYVGALLGFFTLGVWSY